MFLHGMDERGSDLSEVKNHGIPKTVLQHKVRKKNICVFCTSSNDKTIPICKWYTILHSGLSIHQRESSMFQGRVALGHSKTQSYSRRGKDSEIPVHGGVTEEQY